MDPHGALAGRVRRGSYPRAPAVRLAERVVSLPRLVGPGSRAPCTTPTASSRSTCTAWSRASATSTPPATRRPARSSRAASRRSRRTRRRRRSRARRRPVDPRPFRPVLRGLLLTGSTPRYMRAEVSGGRGEDWAVSEHALWWPPSKIAGRWLAPYLALRHAELEEAPGGSARGVVSVAARPCPLARSWPGALTASGRAVRPEAPRARPCPCPASTRSRGARPPAPPARACRRARSRRSRSRSRSRSRRRGPSRSPRLVPARRSRPTRARRPACFTAFVSASCTSR